MRFVFCGFDFFDECLRRFLEAGHELHAAFCQPVDGYYNSNLSVRSICKAKGVSLQERKITVQDIEAFKKAGCHFLVSAAHVYKIPANELRSAGIRGINIHPTLLPEGRGPWPLPRIIFKDLKKSGVTIHELSEEFDSGDILAQKSFNVMPDENLETLSCKSQMIAADLVSELTSDSSWIKRAGSKQGKGSYWAMPNEAERCIDWNKPVIEIDRVIRAFGKFESWAKFDGKDWLVQDGTVWKEKHNYIPGQVVQRTNKEVVISAKDGFVCVRQFKLELTDK